MADVMKFEILEDGTISIKTDKVSGANHVSADQMLKELATLAGGTYTVAPRRDVSILARTHTHADGTTHTH